MFKFSQSKKESIAKYAPPDLPLPINDPTIVQMIKSIRERFLEDYKNNPELYISSDVEDILSNDFRIRRCIYGCKLSENAAYEMFRNTLEWRKAVGFEGATPTRFPLEFYKIGGIFEYMPDKDGTPLLYIRLKIHKRLDVLTDPIKKFIVYNMDLMDKRLKSERSWAIVFDASNGGLANVDLNLLYFLITTAREHFCWSLRYVAVYELPWILVKAWNIALMMIPEDGRALFRLCNKNNITEIVDPKNLPDFMNGTCKKDYRAFPPGAKTAEEVGALELGLKPEDVRSLVKHFEKHL